MTNPIRVLVVDDSAFARKVLREVLSASPSIEVVGIARDGIDALEKIEELKPDVVTLDLVMPNLDGLGVLRALPAEGAPRVVVVSMADEQGDLALSALREGAIDLVHKPTALAIDRLYELSNELVQKVQAAAGARVPGRTDVPDAPSAAPMPRARESLAAAHDILVIGASTGGPQAVTRLIRALPADFPVPVAVVLHIPIGFTESLAHRLNAECALSVVEASSDLELRPGLAVIARAGIHLKMNREHGVLRAALERQPINKPHRPSVDVLFESAAQACGARVLGVVLTGMGDDGLIGSRAIREAGGTVLTEAESSCVVYGMPRVVHEAGLATAEAPIEQMAATIVAHL